MQEDGLGLLAKAQNIHVCIGMRAERPGLWFLLGGGSWAAEEAPVPRVPGARGPPGRPKTHGLGGTRAPRSHPAGKAGR